MSIKYTTTQDLLKKHNLPSYSELHEFAKSNTISLIPFFSEKSYLPERRNKFQTLLKNTLKQYGFILDTNGSKKTYMKTYIKKSEHGFYYIDLFSHFSMRENAYHVSLAFSPYIHNMHEGFMADHTTPRIEADLGIKIVKYSFSDEDYIRFDLDSYQTDEEAVEGFVQKVITDPVKINPVFSLAEENYLKNKLALETNNEFKNLAEKWLEIAIKDDLSVEESFKKNDALQEIRRGYESQPQLKYFLGAYINVYYSKKFIEKPKVSQDVFYKWTMLSVTYFSSENSELANKYKSLKYYSSSYDAFYNMSSAQLSYMLFMTFIEKYMQ